MMAIFPTNGMVLLILKLKTMSNLFEELHDFRVSRRDFTGEGFEFVIIGGGIIAIGYIIATTGGKDYGE